MNLFRVGYRQNYIECHNFMYLDISARNNQAYFAITDTDLNSDLQVSAEGKVIDSDRKNGITSQQMSESSWWVPTLPVIPYIITNIVLLRY